MTTYNHNDVIKQIWTSAVWTGDTTNTTSVSMSSYTDYYSTNSLKRIVVKLSEEIVQEALDKTEEKHIKPDPIPITLETVKFNPENLWSESKCLKQNIVQSVKKKLLLDIIFQIKTLKLKREKSLGTIFTKE